MNKALLPIVIASCALVACKPHGTEAPAPAASQDAIKALGSTVPDAVYDRSYWQKEHDANTSAWQQAERLCEQTVLATYPNCMPVAEVLQAEQREKAQAGDKAASKIEDMSSRGYLYDYLRKTWLPAIEMQSAGCVSVPAYPNNPRRIGFSTWKCPAEMSIPTGIPDKTFSKEEEYATD